MTTSGRDASERRDATSSTRTTAINVVRGASASHGQKIPYYQPSGAYMDNDSIVMDGQTICQVNELKLLGKHNWQNCLWNVLMFQAWLESQ